MNGLYGLPLLNIHYVEKTLDENKQVTSGSNLEYICSVFKDGKLVDATFNIDRDRKTKCKATVPSLNEGDTVHVVLTCMRSAEGGGFCESKIVQKDEDTYQIYLDAQ